MQHNEKSQLTTTLETQIYFDHLIYVIQSRLSLVLDNSPNQADSGLVWRSLVWPAKGQTGLVCPCFLVGLLYFVIVAFVMPGLVWSGFGLARFGMTIIWFS